MSAVQTSGYDVRRGSDALSHYGWPYKVCAGGVAVDAFRTQSGARYAARLLNAGLATIDPHATVGSRVVAVKS